MNIIQFSLNRTLIFLIYFAIQALIFCQLLAVFPFFCQPFFPETNKKNSYFISFVNLQYFLKMCPIKYVPLIDIVSD